MTAYRPRKCIKQKMMEPAAIDFNEKVTKGLKFSAKAPTIRYRSLILEKRFNSIVTRQFLTVFFFFQTKNDDRAKSWLFRLV